MSFHKKKKTAISRNPRKKGRLCLLVAVCRRVSWKLRCVSFSEFSKQIQYFPKNRRVFFRLCSDYEERDRFPTETFPVANMGGCSHCEERNGGVFRLWRTQRKIWNAEERKVNRSRTLPDEVRSWKNCSDYKWWNAVKITQKSAEKSICVPWRT